MKNDVNGYSIIEEIWHAISHGIGLALSIAGLTIMVTFAAMSGSVIAVVSSAIFGATLILLYGSSTLYHAITHLEIKQRFQQFDHASIYLLIAGSYTPITLVSLGGAWGWSIFAMVWIIAVIGITITFVYPGRSEKLSLFLYITMGWIIVIAIKPLLENMESGGLWLLLAGGFSYSVGVLFYVWEKLPFNHAIWHLFVLG
ncbi:MAG: hemolysin III family protein, partial [Thiovulaceae bacterium]|nr:hemolysin III family protein [Sulfurimonadaceae bacterium]